MAVALAINCKRLSLSAFKPKKAFSSSKTYSAGVKIIALISIKFADWLGLIKLKDTFIPPYSQTKHHALDLFQNLP